MIFKVKNLGYIEEAEVDLSKDLIVFTGQNNTGKTYLAYAIYGLYNLDYLDIPNDIIKHIPKSTKDKFLILARKFIKEGFLTLSFSDYLQDFQILINQISKVNDRLDTNLVNVFSTNQINYFENFKFSISIDNINLKDSFAIVNDNSSYYQMKQNFNDSYKLNALIIKSSSNIIFQKINDITFLKPEIEYDEIVEFISYDFIITSLAFIFPELILKKQTYIAPAERNAINIFSKELSLSKSKIVNGTINTDDKKPIGRYPVPIQDNLEIAEDLAHLSKSQSDFAYLAEELEQDFLKGKIATNQYGQIEYTPDNADKVNLEVHLTASMVKSLSNIVFYLRHLAQKGDCIIIDEPELNLHPDNQRKIARFLGRLVNEGFQVVISTHSDYIIKELNNMIMLSKAKGERDELIKELGFRGDELLKPEQVEAQLFTLKSRKPEKIQITDEGFEVSTINEVIEQQDNDLEKIYYELFQKVL